MTSTAGPLAVALLAATMAVTAGSRQDPAAPIFRTGTETVAIYATVLDRGGGMVLDLDRDAFEVYDNGERQELTVFVRGLQPISAALLVDTSASMTLNLDLARTAAEQFVLRMLPGDTARIGSFSDRVVLGGEFTGDRDTLLRALGEDLDIGNPTKLWDALDETITVLTPREGRRVIMMLTDGIDTASRVTADSLFMRTRADDLMIYVVQFRTTARASLAEAAIAPSASELFSSRGTLSPRDSMAAVRALARQTGGGHFALNQYDDVNATFTHVMQELHNQYVLGFTPRRADGRVHDLQVRVNRPWLSVRARQTYLAPRPGSTERP